MVANLDAGATNNWASEASPTLGCSIEILRDMCLSWAKMRRRNYVDAQSQSGAVKTDL